MERREIEAIASNEKLKISTCKGLLVGTVLIGFTTSEQIAAFVKKYDWRPVYMKKKRRGDEWKLLAIHTIHSNMAGRYGFTAQFFLETTAEAYPDEEYKIVESIDFKEVKKKIIEAAERIENINHLNDIDSLLRSTFEIDEELEACGREVVITQDGDFFMRVPELISSFDIPYDDTEKSNGSPFKFQNCMTYMTGVTFDKDVTLEKWVI